MGWGIPKVGNHKIVAGTLREWSILTWGLNFPFTFLLYSLSALFGTPSKVHMNEACAARAHVLAGGVFFFSGTLKGL